MATDLDKALQRVDEAEQLFKSTLKSRFGHSTTTKSPKLLAVLADFCAACEEAFSLDYAKTYRLESILWDAHCSVSSRYRSGLKKLSRKTKPVEWRVIAEEFTAFIKQSQVFYRSHVRSLDSRAGGIDGLREVAQSWKQDVKEASRISAEPKAVDAALKQRIVVTCRDSLMHLGDLSRWRHAEKLGQKGKERYPKEAVGYYELAEVLIPHSGVPQHQLGVLAANDAKAFRAMFHFYRSLCAMTPHPLAQQNLELELKKINAWNIQQLLASCMPSDQNKPVATLKAWFVRFHGQSYSGLAFPGQSELEEEVLSRLSAVLKSDVDMSSTLLRMVLINIAAEGFARKKQAKEASSENTAAFSSFRRLNVKTFIALFRLFETALEDDLREDVGSPSGKSVGDSSIKVPKLGRRTLASMVLYALWLTTNWRDLNSVESTADITSVVAVQDLWRVLGNVLSLLAKHIPVAQLPTVDYLLPEEEMTIGFAPVHCPFTEDNWTLDNGNLKAHYATRNKRDSPVDGADTSLSKGEDLTRVRTILACGVRLALAEADAPLQLDQETQRFFYEDPNIPAELLQSRPSPVAASAYQRDVPKEKASPSAGQQPAVASDRDSERNKVQWKLAAQSEPGNYTVDVTEMVAQLTAEDEQGLQWEGHWPFPHANMFDSQGPVGVGRRPEVPETVPEASPPNMRSPQARSRPQSGVPSPTLSHHQQSPLPSRGNIWSSRPNSGIYSTNGLSSPYIAPSSPWNNPQGPVEPHPSNGFPPGPWNDSGISVPLPHMRQRFDNDYAPSSVTPPAFGNGPSGPPLGDAYHDTAPFFGGHPPVSTSVHAYFGQGATMSRNLSSSSHIFDSSRPQSGHQHRSSWGRTPLNGQGG